MHRGIGFWTAVLMLGGFGAAAAAPQAPPQAPDELVVTAPVSSAEHETIEGYFTFGDSLTVMVKPGSELHRFLIRQRGRKMKITFAPDTREGVSRLIRDE